MRLLNIKDMSPEHIQQNNIGLITQLLGSAAGSEKLYVNIDTVPPGAYSTKYHSHSQQEEFFIVIEGTGTLRFNEEEIPVCTGDFFSKTAGGNNAHTFFNSGSVPLKILDIGMVEPEDTCYYPDEGMYLHKSDGKQLVFHKDACETDWSSDPADDL